MKNLIMRGYAGKLTEEEAARRSGKTWYMQHHVVFHRPQKKGKIQSCCAAAVMHDRVSLNNQLHQGPDLTNSLLGVP